MKWIATFYSHYGAIRFKKQCEKQGYKAKLLPVPRELSSSCGTCVNYDADAFFTDDFVKDELEQIAYWTENGYQVVYRATDS